MYYTIYELLIYGLKNPKAKETKTEKLRKHIYHILGYQQCIFSLMSQVANYND